MSSLALQSLPSTQSTRRHESRRWVRLDCEAVRARDFRRVGGQIVDLCRGGLRVAPFVPDLRIGERLFVSFAVDAMTWIDAEAIVVHRTRRGEHVEVGLAFAAMDDASRAALERKLPALPPLLPPLREAPMRACRSIAVGARKLRTS